MAYTGDPNNSMLYAIYMAIHGPDERIERMKRENEVKYYAGTRTLYTNGVKSATAESGFSYEPEHYQLEVTDYRKVIDERKRYLVVKKAPRLIGDDIYIEETDNWVPTGRRVIKTVTSIESSADTQGIENGYYIISW